MPKPRVKARKPADPFQEYYSYYKGYGYSEQEIRSHLAEIERGQAKSRFHNDLSRSPLDPLDDPRLTPTRDLIWIERRAALAAGLDPDVVTEANVREIAKDRRDGKSRKAESLERFKAKLAKEAEAKPKKPKREGPSRKEVIYKAWLKSKKKISVEKAHALSPTVAEGTVKSWLNAWAKGKHFPACATTK